MKLKIEIIERINGRDDLKRSLLNAFKVSRGSIWRFLKENSNNGPLTTAAAMQIICEGLNVTPADILIEEHSNPNNHDSNINQPFQRVS